MNSTLTSQQVKDLITQFNQSSPFSYFFELDYTPDELKSEITSSFSSYYTNQEELNNSAIINLVDCWLMYIKLSAINSEYIQQLNSLHELYYEALEVNKVKAIEALAEWYSDINNSISRFWYLYNRQTTLNELCLEDFVEECLKTIGFTIEGLAKPFLQLTLFLNRIRRKKEASIEQIKQLDLGNIIDELISTSALSNILTIGIDSIRLNQWRNISYHHNATIETNKIICIYKKGGNLVRISVSREQLLETTKRILEIFQIFRIVQINIYTDFSRKIFESADFQQESRQTIREEALLLNFHSALASQGFKMLDLTRNNSRATLTIQDLQGYENFKERSIHTSQFLYHLWLLTESKSLTVIYHLFDGTVFFESKIESHVFIVSGRNPDPYTTLVENIHFSFKTDKYHQNTDPFEGLILDQMNCKNIKFTSQSGQPIDTLNFIKQFTLSVFTNYLILKSEKMDCELKIGSDGAVLTTQNHKKNLLLRTPAIIESPDLQLSILKIVSNIIELYECGELKRELVIQAKNDNFYYLKKVSLKQNLLN